MLVDGELVGAPGLRALWGEPHPAAMINAPIAKLVITFGARLTYRLR
jgi:hypothetical protein